jgi:hypothetical protein
MQLQEVDGLTYPNRAHLTFGVSSSRVRFLVSTFLLLINKSLRPLFVMSLVADERSRHISYQGYATTILAMYCSTVLQFLYFIN